MNVKAALTTQHHNTDLTNLRIQKAGPVVPDGWQHVANFRAKKGNAHFDAERKVEMTSLFS